MANERLDRFVKLLKEIFELDKSDLDFGIYRVMNLRKTQIETFLSNRLPEMVRDTLAPFALDGEEELRAQMRQIEEIALGLGVTVEALSDTAPQKQRYLALQKQLAEGAGLAALETDVYSALYSFFNRYYEEGDFISKRRYKEGVYALPYEGEEVKLYWANQDQYYIKTSENFKDYTFVSEGITVHFRLVDATTERDNNKESRDSKRVFMLFTEDEKAHPGLRTFEYHEEAGELIIRFVYDIPPDKKKKYTEENYAAITKWLLSLRRAELNPLLAPVSTGKGREATTPLEKHLRGYVAKNTFDYFIHKDLRGFLSRELDFFIKNEVMHLDDLDTGSEARVETYLAKVKAIKRVGSIIIDFLAQIEDFQKKLWLKKKFVVETNWCITLDQIEEAFWPEIIANQEQIAEWISMYAIEEADDWSNPPTVEFLRRNRNLLIDTKHFSSAFKERLLESIPDLDGRTSGVLLNSDNYQALQFLLARYEKQVQSIYIDPPYNTDASPIMYKNGYKDSSWLSLIADRVALSKQLMGDGAVLAFAIDDFEEKYAHCVLDGIFPQGELGTVVIRNNPSGRPVPTGFAISHEYTLFYSNTENTVVEKMPRSAELNKRYKEKDAQGIYMWELLRKRGSDSERHDSPKAYYPIYFKGQTARIPDMEWNEGAKLWENIAPPADGEEVCWPIDENGTERRWRWGVETAREACKELMYKTEGGVRTVYYKYRPPTGATAVTTWFDAQYSATEHGTGALKNMFSEYSPFSFPKSVYAVKDALYVSGANRDITALDYFAGSGTTGHAIISLNREDNGNRKYILVEMGEYFDSVTKPRIQKCVYAPDWKDGKPQQRGGGVPQIIKYMSLESYEDALSNIELDQGGQLASLLDDDYLIHYMVDFESRGSLLNVEAFSNPFAYTLKITEKNECRERGIDLCETFNYLIGLRVSWQSAVSYYLSKPAEAPAYEGAVDLVCDIGGQYAFRQIEGVLPDGRRALVIWRTVTEDIIASNAALDAYFTTYRKHAQDRAFEVIFVNGDSNLENLRRGNEAWRVQITEIEFKRRMFGEV